MDAPPDSRPWYAGATRYQWLVLAIASAGWVFDAFEGQLFNITRGDLLPDLLQTGRDSQEVKRWGDRLLAVFLVGGTLGGVSLALKERNRNVRIAIADPMGAALYSWYTRKELKAEGTSITEGIGQGRVTANLESVEVDLAYQITDEEALPYLFDLVQHEGLVLGGSTAINVAGAVRLAREIGPGKTIVTILADGGQRYQSRLFNPAFLREKKLPVPPWMA